MLGAYQRLVQATGEPEAQRLAHQYLERRGACQGNPTCIAERLLISTELFRQRSGAPSQDLAAVKATPLDDDGDRMEPLGSGPEPELPMAAQPRPDLEVVPVPPARETAIAEVAPRPLEAAPELADAELSSDQAPEFAFAAPSPPEARDLASMESPPAGEAPESTAVVSPSAEDLGPVDV